MKESTKNKIKHEIYEWIKTIIIAAVLAGLIKTFIIQAYKIPSGSMMRTLLIKDHLFVSRFTYGTKIPFTDKKILKMRQPARGEIIVFIAPFEALQADEKLKGKKKNFIKRCIGLPGDIIEIKDKKLFVNGTITAEPYVTHIDSDIYPNARYLPRQLRLRDNFGPVTVPDKHYFMLGDNRDASYDSRFWGFVSENSIIGKALCLYWPPKRIGLIQ